MLKLGLGSRSPASCMPQVNQPYTILKISWKSKPGPNMKIPICKILKHLNEFESELRLQSYGKNLFDRDGRTDRRTWYYNIIIDDKNDSWLPESGIRAHTSPVAGLWLEIIKDFFYYGNENWIGWVVFYLLYKSTRAQYLKECGRAEK